MYVYGTDKEIAVQELRWLKGLGWAQYSRKVGSKQSTDSENDPRARILLNIGLPAEELSESKNKNKSPRWDSRNSRINLNSGELSKELDFTVDSFKTCWHLTIKTIWAVICSKKGSMTPSGCSSMLISFLSDATCLVVIFWSYLMTPSKTEPRGQPLWKNLGPDIGKLSETEENVIKLELKEAWH